MYFCYLLRCADGSLYTGVTTDVERRLREHNGTGGSRYTSSRRPVQLAWKEAHADRSSAQRREAEIKGWSRKRKLALVRNATVESKLAPR